VDRWKEYGRQLRATASASTVGIEMALFVVVGYFVGDYLDSRLDWAPCCLIGFVILGSIAGFLNLFRRLKRLNLQDDDE